MEYVITAVLALVLGLILGRVFIPLLRALKAGQSIREIGPTWHQSKSGTPTMGGVIFILAALVCIPMSIPQLREGNLTHLAVFAFALIYGLIGFLDDYVKVKKHRNLGLTSLQKLVLQLAVAACYLALLRWSGHLSSTLYVPFWNESFTISWPVYLIFAMFVIVGCVNTVNLTDGVDGLATGVTIPVMVFYARTWLCSSWPCWEALSPFCSTISTRPRSLWATPARCFWAARCAVWPLPWICLWLWSPSGSSTLPRPCPTSSRWAISSSPMASGCFGWLPCTIILRWAAGARSKSSLCSAVSPCYSAS